MLLSEDELKASAVIDPSVEQWMKENPSPPLDWQDAPAIRAGLKMMEDMTAQQIGPANPEISTESYQDITLRDGYKTKMKVSKPVKAPAGGAPLIVLAFGGGWLGGSPEIFTPLARLYTKGFGAVCVSIDYRLAPENKFPTAVLDGWDQLKWCAENAKQLGADSSKGFIMGGISAGGSVTSACVTKAIEEPLAVPLTGQYLGVPTLMRKEHVPEKYQKYHLAWEHNEDTPILGAKDIPVIDGHQEADLSSPLRHPILSKAPLSKQPKAYFQADGLDPLRDDALIWDEMLKEAGVKTRIDFYPGCPHAHWAFMPTIPISIKGMVDNIQGMAWLLGKELSEQEVMGILAP